MSHHSSQVLDTKRKRDTVSPSSSTSSSLSWKKIKQALSFSSTDTESSFSLEDSYLSDQQPAAIEPTTIPTATPAPVSIQPIETSTPAPITMSKTEIIDKLSQMLDEKLSRQRNDIISEMKNIVTTQISEVKVELSEEIQVLRGQIHDINIENSALKAEIDQLKHITTEGKKRVEDAKIHSIENDQYARRSNIIVYGVQEIRNENPGQLVTNIVKEKLNIILPPNSIEVCHRLGTRTLNKNRPIVARFRYRDLKWDIMKARKSLKGTGIVFGEDLCLEFRELQNEIRSHPNISDCWAWNGKLFAKSKGGKIITIKYGSRWQDKLLANDHEDVQPPESGEGLND